MRHCMPGLRRQKHADPNRVRRILMILAPAESSTVKASGQVNHMCLLCANLHI
jgi:hypothetical protein